MERFQMDLLQRLTMRGGMEPEFHTGGEELELSLGLSLGGSYGEEKTNERSLVRSSSVAVTMGESMEEDDDEDEEVTGMATPLVRTASLPVEAAEEWRKRKELQTLRRLEAKRRRCEKQRLGRSEKEGETAATTATTAMFLAAGKVASPAESQGGSSSGMSESESKSVRGRWQGEWRRRGKEREKAGGGREVRVEDMPCVFTKGDGPEGRRVEGILYKYGQREEVRIMCVCHGSFLSPSDFIKHAGGSHVSNPLRHIVVTPSSFF